jgi:hypothetical protein
VADKVPLWELRPLADWCAELGFDRLRADLISGAMGAWFQPPLTSEWHPIPRAHWEHESAVERAVNGRGWLLGVSQFSVRLSFKTVSVPECIIRAARPLSPEVSEPTQVKVVNWPTKLRRRLLAGKVETETEARTEVASVNESEEPQTSEAWLRWAVGKWPQKSGETLSAYARQLHKKPKAREFWKHHRSLYTKLYEYELVRKKGG